MRGFVKMSALSAVLSFTLVTAYNQAWSSPTPPLPTTKYQDRLSDLGMSGVAPALVAAAPARTEGTKGDRLAAAASCADQTWPSIASGCLSAASDGPPKRVRMITVETREGANTSVLSRVPQADVASR